MFKNSIFKFVPIVVVIGFFQTSAFSQENFVDYSKIWEHFSGENPTSKSKINFQPLTDMLEATVLPVGRSKGVLGSAGRTKKFKRSNISFGNSSPSRYEGNRMFLHAMTKDHENFYDGFLQGLENLPERRALKTYSSDVQLTFWLNLHNVLVIRELIREYPIQKLNKFKKEKNGSPGFWDKKMVTIEGVPLSVSDIEKIIIGNWASPLVIYGFYQGSIGGPTLARTAFGADNVWKLLEENAIEFINSNRGARSKGNRLLVSEIYHWYAAAFDNSDQKILDHIKTYSDPEFHGDISRINEINAGYYDWVVADLAGGVIHSGETPNPAAILSAKTGSNKNNQFQGFLLNNMGLTRSGLANMPAAGMNLIVDVFLNNEVPKLTPIITTEECAPGEVCEVAENPDN